MEEVRKSCSILAHFESDMTKSWFINQSCLLYSWMG